MRPGVGAEKDPLTRSRQAQTHKPSTANHETDGRHPVSRAYAYLGHSTCSRQLATRAVALVLSSDVQVPGKAKGARTCRQVTWIIIVTIHDSWLDHIPTLKRHSCHRQYYLREFVI